MKVINYLILNLVRKFCSVFWVVLLVNMYVSASNSAVTADSIASPIEFISSKFDNATPLNWEYKPDGSVLVHISADRERSSPNRASNHVLFQVQAKKGAEVKLMVQYFDEIWNGRTVASHNLVDNFYISDDGRNWEIITAEKFDKGHQITFVMKSSRMFVGTMEPYSLSDYNRLLEQIKNHPLVNIEYIGKTVEGRDLEIIRIGKETAPFRVFIRGRAHPWEAGGNWLLHGMINKLLDKNTDNSKYLDLFCVYLLGMANKDGVARGGTRFNSNGIDINRGMNLPADPQLAPENYAMETWLKKMESCGMKPHVAMDLHNDRNGHLGFGNPQNAIKKEYSTNQANSMFAESYLLVGKNVDINHFKSNIERFEALMYKYTMYSWVENGVVRDKSNPGNVNAKRYDVNIAAILELHQSWIKTLNKAPFGKDWQLYGEQMLEVFYHYFKE